jgi:hypothetical protein
LQKVKRKKSKIKRGFRIQVRIQETVTSSQGEPCKILHGWGLQPGATSAKSGVDCAIRSTILSEKAEVKSQKMGQTETAIHS